MWFWLLLLLLPGTWGCCCCSLWSGKESWLVCWPAFLWWDYCLLWSMRLIYIYIYKSFCWCVHPALLPHPRLIAHDIRAKIAKYGQQYTTAAKIEKLESSANFVSYVTGDYPESLKQCAASNLPSFTAEQKELLKGSLDFLGINFYTGKYVFIWYVVKHYSMHENNMHTISLYTWKSCPAQTKYISSVFYALLFYDNPKRYVWIYICVCKSYAMIHIVCVQVCKGQHIRQMFRWNTWIWRERKAYWTLGWISVAQSCALELLQAAEICGR